MLNPTPRKSTDCRAAFVTPALKTEDAATYCGLAPATMEGLRCKGGGPRFIKYGRKAVRYLVADLDFWIAKRARFSTSDPSRP